MVLEALTLAAFAVEVVDQAIVEGLGIDVKGNGAIASAAYGHLMDVVDGAAMIDGAGTGLVD